MVANAMDAYHIAKLEWADLLGDPSGDGEIPQRPEAVVMERLEEIGHVGREAVHTVENAKGSVQSLIHDMTDVLGYVPDLHTVKEKITEGDN